MKSLFKAAAVAWAVISRPRAVIQAAVSGWRRGVEAAKPPEPSHLLSSRESASFSHPIPRDQP